MQLYIHPIKNGMNFMKKTKRSTKSAAELKEAKKWLKASKYFESDDSLKLLELSLPTTPEEHRQILGAGNRKPISIRIPENDLAEIQKIAAANGRKYQQLIVQAIELYIDNYYSLVKMNERREY